MSFKTFIISALFFSLTLIVYVIGVSAQGRSCSLRVMAYRFDDDAPVRGASVTLTETATRKVYQSTLKDGVPFFVGLGEGKYQLTTEAEGYQKSRDDLTLTCASVSDGIARTSIPLWEGSAENSSPVSEKSASSVVAGKDIAETSSAKQGQSSAGESTAVKDVVAVGLDEEAQKLNPVMRGVLNTKAVSLARPVYPISARRVGIGGAVFVDVIIDESGTVIAAAVLKGNPLLSAASVTAAKKSKFNPAYLQGEPIKIRGVIVYNFVP